MLVRIVAAAVFFAIVVAAPLCYIFHLSNEKERKLHAQSVVKSLERLGFDDVVVQKCVSEFSHKIVPTAKNNGTFAYWRYLNLDTLRDLSTSDIESLENLGGAYILTIEFDLDYSDQIRPLYAFLNWLKENHPERHQEYYYPRSQDELVSRIELFAREKPNGWDVWGNEV